MKAREITKSGFYWYQKPPVLYPYQDWQICLVDLDGGTIEFCGTDNNVSFPDHRFAGYPESLASGEDEFLADAIFVGPLNPPESSEPPT
jgi:hypothetical protein